MDLNKNQPDFLSVNTFLPNPAILLLDLSVLSTLLHTIDMALGDKESPNSQIMRSYNLR
jgi:hypothetical protein